jgi:protein-tyrosine phosphatase
MPTKRPIEFSYKVTATFYAGEYPFAKETDEGIVKLQKLLDFGIRHFIDMTSERLTKYDTFLPKDVAYTHLPTNDYTVPAFDDLKKIHDIVNQFSEKVYVHCKGGYDRTGATVATYFIYAGQTPAQAKKRFREVSKPVKGRYPYPPLIESNWKVLDEYKEYLEGLTPQAVAINRHATRLLWEGVNSHEQVRKVYYIEYEDGVHILLLTDAEGKTISYMDTMRICDRYMPWKWNDDQPDDRHTSGMNFGE